MNASSRQQLEERRAELTKETLRLLQETVGSVEDWPQEVQDVAWAMNAESIRIDRLLGALDALDVAGCPSCEAGMQHVVLRVTEVYDRALAINGDQLQIGTELAKSRKVGDRVVCRSCGWQAGNKPVDGEAG